MHGLSRPRGPDIQSNKAWTPLSRVEGFAARRGSSELKVSHVQNSQTMARKTPFLFLSGGRRVKKQYFYNRSFVNWNNDTGYHNVRSMLLWTCSKSKCFSISKLSRLWTFHPIQSQGFKGQADKGYRNLLKADANRGIHWTVLISMKKSQIEFVRWFVQLFSWIRGIMFH